MHSRMSPAIVSLAFAIIVATAADQRMVVTAYCSCEICCGHYSGSPTASGVMPKEGVTVAAPREIPFGTVLRIAGVGDRIVQDRLHQRFDRRIDIYFNNHQDAKRFGLKKLRVVRVRERKT